VLRDERGQRHRTRAKLVAGQLVGSRGGPPDDIGDPDPAREEGDPVGIGHPGGRVDPALEDSGAQQRRIEPVARVGKMRPGRGRPQTRIDTDEEQPQAGTDEIGHIGVAEGLQLRASESGHGR
jgi:hypothetical protein